MKNKLSWRQQVIKEAKKFKISGPINISFWRPEKISGQRGVNVCYSMDMGSNMPASLRNKQKFSIFFPAGTDIETVKKVIHRELRALWIHEFEELLTYDGLNVYDAHPIDETSIHPGSPMINELF